MYRLVSVQFFVRSVYTSSAILTAYSDSLFGNIFPHGVAVVALVPLLCCETLYPNRMRGL